jgi:hypothetical protein
LKRGDSSSTRIAATTASECGAALREHGIAGIERGVEVGAHQLFFFGSHRTALDHARAAVDDQRGLLVVGLGGVRKWGHGYRHQ